MLITTLTQLKEAKSNNVLDLKIQSTDTGMEERHIHQDLENLKNLKENLVAKQVKL